MRNNVVIGDVDPDKILDMPLMLAKKADPAKVNTNPAGARSYKDASGTIFATDKDFDIKVSRDDDNDGTPEVETYSATWADAMSVIDNFATNAEYDITLMNAGEEVIVDMGSGGKVAAPVFPKAVNAAGINVMLEDEGEIGELRYTGALNPSVNISFNGVKLSEGKMSKQNGVDVFEVTTDKKTGIQASSFKLSNPVTVEFNEAYTETVYEDPEDHTSQSSNLLRFTGGFNATKGSVKLTDSNPDDDYAYEAITRGAVTLDDVIVSGDAAIVSDDWTYGNPADMLGKVTITSIHGDGDSDSDVLQLDSVYTAAEPEKSVSQVNVKGMVTGATLALRPIMIAEFDAKNKIVRYEPMPQWTWDGRNLLEEYTYWDTSKAPEARLKFMDGAQIPSGNVAVYVYKYDDQDPDQNGWVIPNNGNGVSLTTYKGGLFIIEPWNAQRPDMMWNAPIVVTRGELPLYSTDDWETFDWSGYEWAYFVDWDQAVSEVTAMAASDNDAYYTMAICRDIGAEFDEDNYPRLNAVTMKKMTFPSKVNNLNVISINGNYGFYFTDPAVAVASNLQLVNVSLNCAKENKKTVGKTTVVEYDAQNYNISAGKNNTLTYTGLENYESDYSPIGSMVGNISGGSLNVHRHIEGMGDITTNELYVDQDSQLEMLGEKSTVKTVELMLEGADADNNDPLKREDEESWGGLLRASNITVTGGTSLNGWTELRADSSAKSGTGVINLKDVYVYHSENAITGKQNDKHASLVTVSGDLFVEDVVNWSQSDPEENEYVYVPSAPVLIGLLYCNSKDVHAKLYDGDSIVNSAKVDPNDIRLKVHDRESEWGHVVRYGYVNETDEGFLYHLDRPEKSKSINFYTDEEYTPPVPPEP